MTPADATRRARPSGVRRRLRLRLGLWLLEGRSSGRRLPSVRRFAEITGVHRNTAAAVYRDLARFGLVRGLRGSGTYSGGFRARRPRPAIPVDTCPGLRAALAAELDGAVHTDDGSRATPLLVPLDEIPPLGRVAVPVAPRGPAIASIRRLRPGDDVVLLSTSPRLGQLVRHVLEALHGPDVGLVRVVEGVRPPSTGRRLVLGDACRPYARGTTRAGAGFIRLDLLDGDGRAAVDPRRPNPYTRRPA